VRVLQQIGTGLIDQMIGKLGFHFVRPLYGTPNPIWSRNARQRPEGTPSDAGGIMNSPSGGLPRGSLLHLNGETDGEAEIYAIIAWEDRAVEPYRLAGGAALAATLLCGSLLYAAPAQTELARARALYQHTEYRQALEIAESIQPKAGPTYLLVGQCYFMLEDYKKASDAFEQATAVEGNNSTYWNWLGRAYGKRAETSSFLTAPRYASQARQQFEKAVQIDPKNIDAVDDLFEYYLEAPGFLGGGTDKAAKLSETIRSVAPAKYHSLQARLAERLKQIPSAERHLRDAIEAAPTEAGRMVDLARFLARQGRAAESDAAFERAAQLAPDSAEVKFQRARSYIDSGRNTAQARQLLEEYLKSSLTPDDPPRSEATKLLQKITRG
jgi:cytochrome c-type biogenesis protein CcmH/NrfG